MPDGLVAKIGTTYDDTRKQFKREGRWVSRASARRELDKLTERFKRDAVRIGERYARGGSLIEFEAAMRDLLKSAHVVASSVGRGGLVRMNQSDWGKVGNRLKREYGYLSKFVRRLEKGKIPKAITPNRAKRYANSVIMSYHETVHKEATKDSVSEIKVRLVQNSKEGCEECAADAARGWVNVEDMDELGTRICGNFCLCDLEFSDMVNE